MQIAWRLLIIGPVLILVLAGCGGGSYAYAFGFEPACGAARGCTGSRFHSSRARRRRSEAERPARKASPAEFLGHLVTALPRGAGRSAEGT